MSKITKEAMKNIKGQFVSVWDDGSEISTYCELDPSDGELFPTVVETGDHGSLEREYFQTPDGDELEVCTTCHEFILKTVMNPGIGHDLNEEQVCSNPECESQE